MGRVKSPRSIHFVAIGGTGMGALAGLLHARGLSVTGTDEKLYPPMSTALERWGIPVREGFRAENVIDANPELVVIGNAVRPDNPEARAAIDEGFPYRSFSDALYELAMAGRHSVVIAGTHGKTTTTSLVAYLLKATGRDPSLLVGGISLDFDGSFREGQGAHFVVEGDEYDTAFFDKTPKFLHYHPRTLLLTSVEFDHADIYRDLDHVKDAFRKLVSGMPADGTIVAATAHACVRDVVKGAPCRVIGYAADAPEAPAAWQARALSPDAAGTRFELWRDGARAAHASTPLHGGFNVENSLGALATVCALGVPQAEALAALPRFRGVKRRMEVRGTAGGVTVLDDFAHHPTAVAASLGAARARFPGRRVLAVFEPRSNTSRRAVFQNEYVDALAEADLVFVRRVPDAPIYSAFGEVRDRLSAERIVETLTQRGIPAVARESVDEIVESIGRSARSGDVVLVMSNGDFGGIWGKLLEELGGARA
ncbi:MAG TPA: UDP-N-acetylmuramate:L-alanyl-gamma-D-glutamyl-meso-diaminopimelate ligase [Myxococcota bacterium]|nr:UDP-N-acetylmuramate:L-alanyl-gamma-D-glutamyl-meso-diaminopimelate ligase [Myxococcota bacterium]